MNNNYSYQNTRRRHTQPDLLAALIVAIAQFNEGDTDAQGNARAGLNHRICGEGFSYEDGSCYPSTSHANGKAFDTNYLISEALEDELTNAMRFYGINYQGRGVSGWKPNIDHSQYLARHEGHLHSGGRNFDQDFIQTIL